MKTKQTVLFLIVLSALTIGCKPNLNDGVYAKFETSKGDMLVKLRYKETPVTVANFISLAEGTNTYLPDSLKKKPFYNGTIFHRVIKGFMIQGGDKTATGMGSPGYSFADEIVDTLKHVKKGILSMANAGPGTNGSQFFITQVPTPHLDGRHTVFGEVISGLEVIDTIANAKTKEQDRPLEDIVIKNVEILRKGKEAKAFHAVKVFDKAMKEVERKKEENQKKRTAAIAGFLEEIKAHRTKATKYPSGISIFTIKEATGSKPQKGSFVMINYAGYLTDGTLFDTSIENVADAFGLLDERRKAANMYKPFKMEYSEKAGLIPGFKEAMLNLKVGQKVRVFIPAKLGYGERGAGPIPPNSELIFDIELTDIAK